MPRGSHDWSKEVMACKAARERQERTQEMLAPLRSDYGRWTLLDAFWLQQIGISVEVLP